MRKIILIIWLCCFCNLFSYSQNDSIINNNQPIQHNLFVEFLGSSANIYNITYDCTFAVSEKNKIAIATGIGYMSQINPSVSISFQANYLYGKKHHLEIGTGITFPEIYSPIRMVNSTTYDWRFSTRNLVVPVRIGYRYQRNDGGFFWKIAFVPLFSKEITNVLNLPFRPSIGVSLGYTFKPHKKVKQVANSK